MKKQIYVLFAIMILSSLFILNKNVLSEQNNDFEIISVSDASKLIDKNKDNQDIVILDVRTHEEYKSGHIANSVNINYKSSDFKEQIEKLDKNKSYITYCRSGRRSTGASQTMKELGFQKIIMIQGGMTAWSKEGLPVSSGN